MGWFGIAMARAGYVVIGVDHPGNNATEAMTPAAAILPWDRAEDLRSEAENLSVHGRFLGESGRFSSRLEYGNGI